VQAIATSERTVSTDPAPFDRWVEGDETALSVAAKRGLDLLTGTVGLPGCPSAATHSKYGPARPILDG
jgi:cytochrome c peroxidase